MSMLRVRIKYQVGRFFFFADQESLQPRLQGGGLPHRIVEQLKRPPLRTITLALYLLLHTRDISCFLENQPENPAKTM
jgi:hypothetical protein